MIDVGEVMGEVARVGLNESVRVAAGMFSSRAKRAERREAVYADFLAAVERAHVRVVLVHAVAAGRKHPLGVVANATGYRAHVELVDRLADDLVALSAALQKVHREGDQEVAAAAHRAVDALSALATTVPGRAKRRALGNRRKQDHALEKTLVDALHEFRKAAAIDVRN
ncbi:hypothetical protein [Ornithinimicrobium sufpigmenti]|uniref:hypothetical protein n=1 Tax=Ornithinimicrobium sufpigmenti TaxID=2508882 RepID=UPI0010357F2C|nr:MULTISPECIES: hypothetical protein [unclassified Ornithinimicrobium]